MSIHSVPMYRATGRSKGFALLQFMEPADAVAAHASLDGATFQGRLLHILPARPPLSAGSQTLDEACNLYTCSNLLCIYLESANLAVSHTLGC